MLDFVIWLWVFWVWLIIWLCCGFWFMFCCRAVCLFGWMVWRFSAWCEVWEFAVLVLELVWCGCLLLVELGYFGGSGCLLDVVLFDLVDLFVLLLRFWLDGVVQVVVCLLFYSFAAWLVWLCWFVIYVDLLLLVDFCLFVLLWFMVLRFNFGLVTNSVDYFLFF